MKSIYSASLVKEWFICPRLVYHEQDFPNMRETFSQKEGKIYQKEEDTKFILAGKRSRYGLPSFPNTSCFLESEILGFKGKIDYLWVKENGFFIEELKTSPEKNKKPKEEHWWQLAIYIALVKEYFSLPCLGAFLFYREGNLYFEKNFEKEWDIWQERISNIYQEIDNMSSLPYLPESQTSLSFCRQCRFLNLCPDKGEG